MSNKRIVLAGGSGFLGRSLTKHLTAKGYEVVVLSRSPAVNTERVKQVTWDGRSVGDWAAHLEGAHAVVNLTGKSVVCRYTEANRKEIVASRVNSVNAIGQAVLACAQPPLAWVQAATLAIYGDAGERICDEAAPPGTGFSVETCVAWENAFGAIELPTTRKVLLRIGFALGPDGGALKLLASLTRFYLGGSVGSGSQYISWIHPADLNSMFLWSIEHDNIEGTYNACNANAVTNAEFMHSLRLVLNRPWSPSVPAWAARLGAWAMGTEGDLALTGRRCVPKRFLEAGFEFAHPLLDGALRDLLD